MARIPGEEAASVAGTLLLYRSRILPAARRQLRSWRAVAERIPDPLLRAAALRGLTEKASNAEATAVICALAPRGRRGPVLRACTALQVAIDYLDVLGEQPGADALADGLSLHAALGAALGGGGGAAPGEGGGAELGGGGGAEPGGGGGHAGGAGEGAGSSAGAAEWYARQSRGEDGGYLERLVATCRGEARALPASAAVLPLARRAAIRCGEGQSHTHAAASDPAPLRDWALGLASPPGFEWWEVAAGASSSVAAHALLALAGTPDASHAEAELVDAAYFPSIGALTVLLDDLVDREADRHAGEHNYLDYYGGYQVAGERLAAIAAAADAAISPLHRTRRHRAILSGVLAYYLAAAATVPAAETIRCTLLASSGRTVTALARALAGRSGN